MDWIVKILRFQVNCQPKWEQINFHEEDLKT